ncbi:MAG: transketolase [Candidatus Woesearchaeota archaeon]
MTKIKDLQLRANLIRQDLLKMLHAAGSGHTAGPLGLADLFTALYFNLLKHNPKQPQWEKRDRLILSPGHICPIRYATMAHAGYFPVKELITLRKLGTRLQGHPSRLDLPGVELATASLGQGLGVAVGMALAAKLKKQKHKVFCITSDGEHDEGSTWEAVTAAHKYRLDNLINIIDRNQIQISGFTHEVWPLEPLKEKYESFGWKVLEMNGHDFKQILSVIKKAEKVKKQSVCIISHNTPGKGVSFMENNYHWHGKTPNNEELQKALAELQAEEKRLRKK